MSCTLCADGRGTPVHDRATTDHHPPANAGEPRAVLHLLLLQAAPAAPSLPFEAVIFPAGWPWATSMVLRLFRRKPKPETVPAPAPGMPVAPAAPARAAPP